MNIIIFNLQLVVMESTIIATVFVYGMGLAILTVFAKIVFAKL
jgi:hypothetical protein